MVTKINAAGLIEVVIRINSFSVIRKPFVTSYSSEKAILTSLKETLTENNKTLKSATLLSKFPVFPGS